MGSDSKPDGPALVVGAAGMLGGALSARLSKNGWKVASAGRSVREEFARIRPSVVFNCAAWSDVDGCEREPERARESNALLVKFLAEACSSSGAPLVHISTDYVFDGRKSAPYLETDPVFPVNLYGLTKLEGEYYAAAARVPAVIVRTSWLFGGPNPANFVNAIVRRLKSEKEISVLDDQVNRPTSVADLSAALEKIALRLLADKPRGVIYQVCNAGAVTRLEMARRMKDWLGVPVKVNPGDRAAIAGRLAIRPAYSVMDSSRYEKDFGVKLRSWEEAAREYVTGPAPCAS